MYRIYGPSDVAKRPCGTGGPMSTDVTLYARMCEWSETMYMFRVHGAAGRAKCVMFPRRYGSAGSTHRSVQAVRPMREGMGGCPSTRAGRRGKLRMFSRMHGSSERYLVMSSAVPAGRPRGI